MCQLDQAVTESSQDGSEADESEWLDSEAGMLGARAKNPTASGTWKRQERILHESLKEEHSPASHFPRLTSNATAR